MKMSSLFAGLTLACTLSLATPTQAAVVFSNFDPGNTYNSDDNSDVYGPDAYYNTSVSTADEFIASFTGRLTSVDVAVYYASYFSFLSGSLIVKLYPNDPATNLPLSGAGITLGNLTAGGDPGGVSTLTLPSSSFVPLIAGNNYWLSLEPGSANTAVGWYSANARNSAPNSRANNGVWGDSYAASAFTINATPGAVPEPSTWALLGVGTLALGIALRKSHSLV